MKSRLRAVAQTPGSKVSVPSPAAPSPDNLPPKFCLRQMRAGFSVSDCDKGQQAAFAQRLYELSRTSWADLRQAPRHGQGLEKIPRSAIRGDRVPEGVRDEAEFIAFRCIGKAAMVGYRTSDGVFNIIWIDRNFDLYDHG